MAIVRWQTESSPFSELERLRAEVERLFDDFGSESAPFLSRAYPAVNLSEDEENFYVRAELPGVKPENLDVTVVEGRLMIRGERKVTTEEEGTSYHRQEREGGIFRRVMALPEKVDPGRVSAGLRNGVLTVTLPKSQEAKPRRITVSAS
ncbi:MAG: Hsp20/alpha crystallin family protein [Deltaproteobacteria bacterium]|nr:Hsp20/alpha crystallin family protein [Deltaproteobacteria bacterium]